jgi:hypothetical protein
MRKSEQCSTLCSNNAHHQSHRAGHFPIFKHTGHFPSSRLTPDTYLLATHPSFVTVTTVDFSLSFSSPTLVTSQYQQTRRNKSGLVVTNPPRFLPLSSCVMMGGGDLLASLEVSRVPSRSRLYGERAGALAAFHAPQAASVPSRTHPVGIATRVLQWRSLYAGQGCTVYIHLEHPFEGTEKHLQSHQHPNDDMIPDPAPRRVVIFS